MMRFLGVLSGTSADGIDLGLVDFHDGIELVAFETAPFPDKLQQTLRKLPGTQATLPQLSALQADLNQAFSTTVNAFLQKHGPVRAIGFHGQTLWHDPQHGASWQLGDPTTLAVATDTPVIAGFRQSDLALGGQGAPLAPAFHAAFYGHLPQPVAVVNIGGIANISLITDSIRGWDCGPGNGIMDEIAQRFFNQPYDRNGHIAAAGQVDEALLTTLLQHPYFHTPPPKSTGREQFNLNWLLRALDIERAPQDLMATACALTAAAIARDLAHAQPKTVILCGGGAQNLTLTHQIRHFYQRFGGDKKTTFKNSGGPPSEAIEAMLFAWLAYKRWRNEPVDYTHITGAARPGLYGTLFLSHTL